MSSETSPCRSSALHSVPGSDTAIACWETKFRYNLWRPVTAIHRADEDNNPLTEPDPDWDHFLGSPPFPASTSGHSSFSRAAAQVLTRFYGTDAITFNARSDALPGVVRTFNSLSACADEIGMSRVYGGIHYRFDNREGQRSGRAVAEHIAANFFLPSNRLPLLRVECSLDGQIRLLAHGHFGDTLLIETSADLQLREPALTVTALPGGASVSLAAPPSARALFYRVRQVAPSAILDDRRTVAFGRKKRTSRNFRSATICK